MMTRIRSGSCRPIEILLVEDNPGDVRLTKEALKEGKVMNVLNTVGDGEEALGYLRRQGPYAQAARSGPDSLGLESP